MAMFFEIEGNLFYKQILLELNLILFLDLCVTRKFSEITPIRPLVLLFLSFVWRPFRKNCFLFFLKFDVIFQGTK